MPCIFCVAVLMLIAGALTSEHLDKIEDQLESKAEGEVRRTVDSESVAKFELTVRVGSKSVPVAVTVYKDHKRVRIQVLTHDLTDEEAKEAEDDLAAAIEAKIVDRTDRAHEDSAEHAAEHRQAEAEAAEREKQQAATAEPSAERVRAEERRPDR
ncbi:MAG: hypothetical protein JO087_17110 [Actinobacteria bacterium]|nr:hypothetical protein [Actinomycetota bacterium]